MVKMNQYQKYKKSHEKYRETHRKELRKRARDYYWKHREERLKKMAEYRKRKHNELNQKQRENYQRNLKEERRKDREWQRKLRKENEEKLGWVCCICGKRRKKMVCHEIHGRRHSSSVSYVKNHIKDFILMCSWCHDILHHYTKYRKKFDTLVRHM